MFSVQWTFISIILYVEIVIVLLLLLPWIPPTWWKKIFDSRLVTKVKKFARYYSYAYIFVLLLLFADAVREVRKYSETEAYLGKEGVVNTDSVIHMRLFRAERNLYICGFALLLYLAIKRLVVLLARSANLEFATEAAFNDNVNPRKVVSDTNDKLFKDFEEEKKELLKKIEKLEKNRNKMNEKATNLEGVEDPNLNKRQTRQNSGSHTGN